MTGDQMMRPFPSLRRTSLTRYCCDDHRLEPLTYIGPSPRDAPLFSCRSPFHRSAPAHLTFFTAVLVLLLHEPRGHTISTHALHYLIGTAHPVPALPATPTLNEPSPRDRLPHLTGSYVISRACLTLSLRYEEKITHTNRRMSTPATIDFLRQELAGPVPPAFGSMARVRRWVSAPGMRPGPRLRSASQAQPARPPPASRAPAGPR
jgi:hypothetical protein